jgi:hypothetical protein
VPIYQGFSDGQKVDICVNVDDLFITAPSQAKPSQAKPSQAKPSQAAFDEVSVQLKRELDVDVNYHDMIK